LTVQSSRNGLKNSVKKIAAKESYFKNRPA